MMAHYPQTIQCTDEFKFQFPVTENCDIFDNDTFETWNC